MGADLSVLNLVVVKRGEQEIPGLTDGTKPRRLGPKRASRIRKLFNLEKVDDVRQYVIRREIVRDGKKPYNKAPKIQRLITPQRLQRKRAERAEKRRRSVPVLWRSPSVLSLSHVLCVRVVLCIVSICVYVCVYVCACVSCDSRAFSVICRFEKSRAEAKEYNELVAKRHKEQRDHKSVQKKRSQSRKESTKA